ncbi:MAG: mechanosensitive ion channel family protein [Methanohalobium sp.]|uniref:mechanosensitive ion channel family protein n=1 Tax=Methanohalobium sp. TaxID=2837493 RepID=UPI00397B7376
MVLEDYLTSIFTLIISVVIVAVTNYLLKVKSIFSKDKVTKHIILLLIVVLGIIISIFTLPISTDSKQLILSVIGIAAGATVTFSSTTFIANAASGIMLKIVKPFKIGDYISTNHEFGKVSEVQTLHTQVQSIDRDLITIPNRKLVSETVKTISSTGTIISTEVSLGYDIPRDRVESDLVYAAEKTDLANPFVHVIELGNFAITYKVGGFWITLKI